MGVPKIQLSSAETELMQNASVILTKNSVLQKIKMLLEEVQEQQLDFVSQHDLDKTGFFLVPPKISKGENYSGLPYLIQDYPRITSAKNIFFIRNMFWWGNFFSSTLHLSGIYKEQFKENIERSFPLMKDFFIGINPDPWVHHFEEINYKKIDSLTKKEFKNACEQFNYLKIASKWPLNQWQESSINLNKTWKFFLRICGLIS